MRGRRSGAMRGVAFHGESGRGRRSGAEVPDPSMEIGLSQTSMERAGPGYPIHVAESPSMESTNAESRAPRSGAKDVADAGSRSEDVASHPPRVDLPSAAGPSRTVHH